MNRKWSSLLLVGLASAQSAWAGYLTITGQPQLGFSREGAEVRITGSYKISNSGNEAAKDVFPSFALGNWVWSGEPKRLEAGGAYEWSLNEKIPASKLACKGQPGCAGDFLPDHGFFPVFVLRHYRDLNDYSFSAPDIISAKIGEVSTEQLSRARLGNIEGRLTLGGNGQKFEGTIELRNMASSPARVLVTPFVSRELHVRVSNAPDSAPGTVVEIPARSTTRLPVLVENFGGLDGSTYAVYAAFEWNDEGIRNTNFASGTVRLAPVSYTWWFVGGGALVVAVLLGAYFIVTKKA